jgi:uncharacterized protein YeeX (DUF496 family)
MKLRLDVVGEMDHLVCHCFVNKFRREHELKDAMYWAIQTMQCKMNRVNVLLDQVMQLGRSLGYEHIMKIKANLMDEMEELVHDSLQCQCSLNKFMRG